MNDCQNVAMREALPELVHGALPEAERTRVLAHVSGCEACSGELAIVRAVVTLATAPSIDMATISAAIPPYASSIRHRPFYVAHLRLAAALLLGAVGVSALVVEHHSTGTSMAVQTTGVALVGTSDLSDAHLEQLIQSMGQLEAVPSAEPEPVTPVVFEGDAS